MIKHDNAVQALMPFITKLFDKEFATNFEVACIRGDFDEAQRLVFSTGVEVEELRVHNANDGTDYTDAKPDWSSYYPGCRCLCYKPRGGSRNS